MSKRLFVGIEAGQPRLYESAKALMGELPGKYHPQANYHVTLAFIGCFEEEPVRRALGQMESCGSLTLETLPEPRFFKEGRKAVMYAPVKPQDPLGLLAYRVRRCLREAGIPFDDTAEYIPHITLARGVDSGMYQGQRIVPVQWEAAHFCLFESRSGENGLVYIPLERFRI